MLAIAPVALGLSGLMLLVNRDVNRAASVLTVDFPCAVKLASPMAVRSCMYAEGQAGALRKGAPADPAPGVRPHLTDDPAWLEKSARRAP